MRSKENVGGVLSTNLILEILSRLPAKSIARCRCVSKLWASLLTPNSPYFTELFLTHSKTRPRLLFAVKRKDYEWCLYSCPQPQISYKNPKSSISVTPEFHMSLLTSSRFVHISPSFSCWMHFPNMPDFSSQMLCNPSTGHNFLLPRLTGAEHSYFGYDLINKEFKVLAINCPMPFDEDIPSSYWILTVESRRLSWRNIKCPLHHCPLKVNICINGILYYLTRRVPNPPQVVCFDLNSEEFKFINPPRCWGPKVLVNFKGKLGVIANWVGFSNQRFHLHLSLCVLEDVEKQEWSKHVYDILPTELGNREDVSYFILGVTATGDIVLSLSYTTTPFYVYFFNLETETLQKVEIKGFEGFKRHKFSGCVDYIEELRALPWS